MREHHDHLFGKIRTAVYLGNGKTPDLQDVLSGINQGRMLITNGPFVDMVKFDRTFAAYDYRVSPQRSTGHSHV